MIVFDDHKIWDRTEQGVLRYGSGLRHTTLTLICDEQGSVKIYVVGTDEVVLGYVRKSGLGTS